jgi:hypothetical protein
MPFMSPTLQHDITGTIAFEAFVGNGWTGNVSAQVFEFLALMGVAADLGMEAKALLIDTAHGGKWWLLCRDGLQAQHFLARPGPERDAVGAGRRL